MSGRYEDPDPTPVAIPISFRRPPSIEEMIQKYVRTELSIRAAQQHQAETFEEADDFDVDDDPELRSPYEITADHELAAELARARPSKAGIDAPPGAPAPAAGSGPAPSPSAPEASSSNPP